MAKQPKQRWTDHQYEEWLQDVLAIFTQYVDENRAWPKGAKRFGYLYSEVTAPASTNRLLTIGHTSSSKEKAKQSVSTAWP